MNNRYEIILYWSEPEQAVIAEVPELPGCMADGETYQEALNKVEVLISEWLETAQELGRFIPQPRGKNPFSTGEILNLMAVTLQRGSGVNIS